MSAEEEESPKRTAPSSASTEKDPKIRIEALRKETKGDRKKMALTMKGEGCNRVEISHAFKEVTGGAGACTRAPGPRDLGPFPPFFLDRNGAKFQPLAHPIAAIGCASLFLLRHD